MAEIWKPQAQEVYKNWCKDIELEASDLLSMWETTFITNIIMRLDHNYDLTEAQAIKLEELYVKYTK